MNALSAAWPVYVKRLKRFPRKETLRLESMFSGFVRWMVDNHPYAAAIEQVTADHARAYLRHLASERGLNPDKVDEHRELLRKVFRAICGPLAKQWEAVEESVRPVVAPFTELEVQAAFDVFCRMALQAARNKLAK